MRYTVFVDNIKCGGCANSVKKGLLLNERVKNVEVDVERGRIDIDGADDLDLKSIKEDLKKLGYPEKGTQNSMFTKAKSFVSCAIGRIGN